MESENLTLHELLSAAAVGGNDVRKRFFEKLLLANLFVPVTPPLKAPHSDTKEGTFNLATVEHEGKKVLPVFTDRSFVELWGGEEIECVEKPFKTLIRLMGAQTWMHINPSLEFGKELSPWEIEKLSHGIDAIEDVLGENSFETADALGIAVGNDLYPELKPVLRPILEIYSEIEEAFLIRLKNQEGEGYSALLGIYQKGLSDKKRSSIREEIETCAAAYLPEAEGLIVVDELADPKSPHRVLFDGATPFYFAQRKLLKPGILERSKAVLKNLLRQPKER